MNAKPDSSGQFVFDFFPERADPLEEVARKASPYWKTSRKKIIELADAGADIDTLTREIKHEYCPYGYSGHYGGDGLLLGYNMTPSRITVIYQDHTEEQFTFREFSKTIKTMIHRGEYVDRS